jgi:hypothetical protein
VSSIDGYAPPDDNATSYTVNYHLSVANPPAWANSAETKTAFPKLAAETSGQQMATATLLKTENGWQVQSVQAGPAASNPMP